MVQTQNEITERSMERSFNVDHIVGFVDCASDEVEK